MQYTEGPDAFKNAGETGPYGIGSCMIR